MKIVKITQTHWLQQISQRIDEYVKILDIKGLYASSLMTFFHNVIQFGGNAAEFHVVFSDDMEAMGFVMFSIMPLPMVGCVFLDHVYNWSDDKEATALLFNAFDDFARKHKATIAHARVINGKVSSIAANGFEERNCTVQLKDFIYMVAERKA